MLALTLPESENDVDPHNKINSNLDYSRVYEDVVLIIISLLSLLLSSRSAFTVIKIDVLVKDVMGMIAFISLLRLIPPMVVRYISREPKKNKGERGGAHHRNPLWR